MTCECGNVLPGNKTVWCSERCRSRGRRKQNGAKPLAAAQSIAKILADNGISPDQIGQVDKVKVSEWGKDGEFTATSVVLSPKWADGPEWPVVQQAKPVRFTPATLKRKTKGWKTAVVLPDPQIGFRQLQDGTLDPFHDERAMAAAIAICSYVSPDRIINAGDLLDLPAHSRYVQRPEWQQTTQPAIDRAHQWLAEQKTICADIEVHEGNHDKRMRDYILTNAMAAFGLRQANAPESWPVMSVPHLLRFDDLGIRYVEGYPAAESWINDRLVVRHAPAKMNSVGSSAAKSVEDERVSSIFGHVHRLELTHRTRPKRGGFSQVLSASPGCLCRIDGAVPGANGGVDSFGRPLLTYKDNWQQGVAVVTYKDGDSDFSIELVPIIEGRAIFRGTELAA